MLFRQKRELLYNDYSCFEPHPVLILFERNMLSYLEYSHTFEISAYILEKAKNIVGWTNGFLWKSRLMRESHDFLVDATVNTLNRAHDNLCRSVSTALDQYDYE